MSYAWSFGDDSTGVGDTITHVFDTAGVFNVQLIITDDSAATDTFFLPITVTADTSVGRPIAAIVLSDSTGSSPYAIGFDATASADPAGTLVSYEWDYGDGVQDTGMTAIHTYLVPGTYTVTLIVTNNLGASDTATTSIVINPGNVGPTAAFTASPDSGGATLVVNFDAGISSDPEGEIVFYGWDFGNGNTATGQTVVDSFTEAGIYTVQLFVRDEAGAMDTTSLQITVTPPVGTIPEANMRFVDSLDCATDTFYATLQIRSANTDTFRLGTSSILFSYNDTALTFANYRSLTFDGSDQCIAGVASAWDPHAIDGSSVPGSFNLTMVLNNEGQGCPDIIGTEWVSIGRVAFTINDSLLNPSLVFDTLNTNFNVDQPNDGSITIGKGNFAALGGTDLLTCPVNIPPVAAFTPSPDTGLVPLAVSFDASASFDIDGRIVSYAWTFGDGNTGTGRTAIHTYTAAGEYSAMLIVADDSAATDTLILPIVIRGGNVAPVAAFTSTPDATNAPIGVTFDANSSNDSDGTIVGYYWDFGNGVLDTGAVVIDTFTSAGVYLVTLTIVDDLGAIDTATERITIQPPVGTEPFADLRFADTLNCNDGTFMATLQIRASNTFNYKIGTSSILFTYNDTALQFTDYESYTFDGSDQCIAGVASSWDPHAIDATSVPGAFNLTLVLNNEGQGCPELNGLDWVSVGKVSFSVLDSTLNPRLVFDTLNTNFNVDQPNDGSIVVGKGNFAASEGNLLICPDNEAPIASFIPSPTTGDAPLLVSFDASGSSDADGTIVGYAWNFGDGAISTEVNPTHTYTASGVFVAQLIVTDDLGAMDTALATITVGGNNQRPVASFTSAPDSVNAPIDIGFDATASNDPDGTIVSYSWDFGDGNVGMGVTTTHTYTSAGFYNARLIITDDGGLSDTVFAVVKVLPPIGTEPIVDMRLVDTLDCGNNTFSATLQIRAANTQNFKIGTSSILVRYNDSAIQFTNYESYTFNGSDLCIADVATAWDPHAFDGTSVPGSFNLTMVLNNEGQGCPEVNGIDWVNVGRLDFSIVDSTLDPFMVFDTLNSNFNVDQPNDGSVTVGKGNFAALTGVSLSCSAPDGPIAAFTPTPISGPQPLSVSFDANASSDNVGNIISYDWDYGDGNTGIGLISNNVYTTEGIYTATLVITNDLGQRDTASAIITVQAPPGTEPAARLRLVDSLDCDNKILIATIQIQSRDIQNFKLGTSSVFLTYNDTALQFNSYSSLAFDGSDLCIGGVASSWDVQSFDGTSVDGSFNLTMVLNNEGFGCPEITGTDWVSIGEVRFDVLNSTLNPRINFDSSATNFNVDLPNDGTVVVQKDTLIGLDSVGLLICPGNLAPTASFVADPVAGAPPLTVNFDASSSVDADGTILSYVWDFGDNSGIGANGINVTRVFTAEDTFTVSLIVSDDGGLSDTSTFDIVVSAENIAPLANFTVDPLNGNSPLAVTFDASPSVDADGTIVSYEWDFGDGILATGLIANHTYTVAGLQAINFTATLIVTDDEGARDTSSIIIPVGPPNEPPIASFVFNPNTGEAPIAINFNASASSDPDPGGSIVSYEWDFGDGNSGTGVTATHTYTQGGTFTVRLVVTDDRNEVGTLSRQIVIQAGNVNPVARYTATPITGEAPLAVSFNGSTSTDADGTIASYAWDFGDGTNAVGVTATHTYTTPGVYVSTLTVTDDEGGTGVASVIITVNEANLPPIAAFTPTPSSGTAPLGVTFNGGASNDLDGTIVNYAWTYGDGAVGTGVNSTHTYTLPGTYTVQLTVTDEDGASAMATATIQVNPPLNLAPTALFVATPTAGAPPLLVNFNATTSSDPDGNIVSYAWDFGDGTQATGVTAAHTYTVAGNYTAQLIVTDDSTASDTFTVAIAVNNINVAPTASFIATPTAGAPPLLVSFDASASTDSDGTIISYSWDFGDGTQATGVTATHTYAAAGNYTAQLIVTDDSTASDTFTVAIAVNALNVAPVASFIATPTTGAPPLLVSFDASASTDVDGQIVSYSWDFGDGTQGTGVTATHTYTAAGNYTAQLIVTDDSTASDTFTVAIAVNALNVAPVASFTATPTAGTPPLLVNFNASASTDSDGTIVSYAWDFGDGTQGTGVTAAHTYNAVGTYTAQLIVTDDSTASDTFTVAINVNANQPPTAVFTATPTTGIAPLLVNVDANASTDADGTILSYAWDFGDGTLATGITASHTYALAGNYTVQLIITDDGGALDTATTVIVVQPPVGTDQIADLRIVDTLDCTNNTLTATLQIRSSNTQVFRLGTSSVLLSYNPAALQFSTYESYAFDGSDQCIAGVASSWDAHATDGTSVPGSFNLTMVLNNEGQGCPEVNGTEWVSIGKITYNILDNSLDPAIAYDSLNTNFNVDQPNDGTETVRKNRLIGVSGSDVLSCDSANIPPIALFTATPTAGAPPLLVSFNANASTDSDGTIVSYSWDFGDGTQATGVTATHTYAAAGNYTAQLIVTDDSTASDTFTVAIAVNALNVAPVASFIATPTAGAPPLLVSFDASASTDVDGQIVSYSWDFGDGTQATGVTATHTYAAAGNYTAQLIVTDDSTASDTFTVAIAVNALNVAPVASFIATPTAGAPPLLVSFDASASTDVDGQIVSYSWDFGDGTQATGVTATHTYAAAGNYTAQLIVTDDSTASDTFTVAIAVNALNVAPVASFIATPTEGAPPLLVSFDANGSTDIDGQIVSYDWDFGDGTQGMGVTAAHVYNAVGTYTAQLIVTDDSAASDTFTVAINVIVNQSPTAVFAATPTTGTAPLLVNVDASASTDIDGTILSYAWDFGDGTLATGVTANHTYALAGNYTVQLIITDDGGALDTATAVITVTPPVGTDRIADLRIVDTLDCDNNTLSATLQIRSSNTQVFRLGTSSILLNYNPAALQFNGYESYTFDGSDQCIAGVASSWDAHATDGTSVPGSFNLTMVLNNEGQGCPEVNGTEWVSIGKITYNILDNSLDPAIAYDSLNTNFNVDQPNDGTETVGKNRLIGVSGTDVLGCDSANIPPIALFTATPTAGAPPLLVSFNANASTDSDGTIVSYSWDFGDGTQATGVTATHTYVVAGNYTAQLIVTDDSTASDTFTVAIAVNALNVAPVASFIATPTAGAPPLLVSFDASASTDVDGQIVSYSWDFGDGTQATGVTATHTYTAAGNYTAQLIVTDDSTASDTFTVAIAVNALNVAPVASFIATPTTGAPPLLVSFDASTSTDVDGQIVSYDWDFGDGTQATGVTATHTYTVAGTYTAQLIVTDDSTASDTFTVAINVNAGNVAPVANFTATPTAGAPPLLVSFDASASTDSDGQIVSYDWDFGDGTTGTGVTAAHTYNAVGTFTAQLIVTDDSAASDTFTVAINVNANQPPTAVFTATPTTGAAPLLVNVDANASTDADGTILSYAWDFGDGTLATGVTANHTYALAGNYTVQLIITDDGGALDTATAVITVTPPVGTDRIADLRIVDTLDCDNNTFTATLQIRSANTQIFNLGTSSILLNYNQAALQFSGYESYTFDGSDQCIAGVASSWDAHAFDGTSVPGSFNLTMVLNNEGQGCPEVNGTEWVSIGKITYNILDNSLDPAMAYDSLNTNFNVDQPNDGTETVGKNRLIGVSGADVLSCDSANIPPIALFTATPTAGAPPLLVSFNASASSDPDGTIFSYAWNFGDGSPTADGVVVTHTYTVAGTYTAQLIVTDDSAASDTFTVAINVNAGNVAPVANFTATPTEGAPPLLVSFDASTSTDVDGQIVSYDWDFGDGTQATGVTATHTYTVAGTYTAQLIVTDDSTASDTFTVAINVNAGNVAPVANFTATPTAGAPPLLVSFDASASTDSDGQIVSYAWDFGDGTTGTGVTAAHTYNAVGTFTAQLIVTDDSAASDTFTVAINVNANQPPTAVFTATPTTGACTSTCKCRCECFHRCRWDNPSPMPGISEMEHWQQE